ncbi:MAG: DNA-3-methyladenine glycosylase 2 family protein, partial [Sphingopyxis sp.]
MGLTAQQLRTSIDAIAGLDADIARALSAVSYPEPRIRNRGYATMLRTIVGQQVSVAAAASVWTKLEALLGTGCPAEALTTASFDDLRACGLSRQKQGYARSLADLILSGELV